MARIRTIKPDLTLDEELAELGFAARFFFMNLFCHCDREGRGEDRPKKLQALILPWDDKIDADVLMSELHPHFIFRYEVDGKRYFQVRNFPKHQRPHPGEPKSEIPAPDKEQFEKAVKKHGKKLKNISKTLGKDTGVLILDTGDRKGMDVAPMAQPKEPTPIQRVVMAFKIAKGIDRDNKVWDKANFGRSVRYAQSILECFGGDVPQAVAFVCLQGNEWTDAGLTDWTLAAIAEQAANKAPQMKKGAENELGRSTREPLGHSEIREPRELERTTPRGKAVTQTAGEILANRLEQIPRPCGDEIQSAPFLADGDARE